ncbi:MAG: NADH:flavin oxidoreductase/NADH oxidase, partial [Actinobacteria bacterium]|nr:NADH:flavin oxidoreductase/NADH oxidase [Actinomycetota bacterium]
MSSLFDPLTIRGVTFPNRIWVSPMCQYSAIDGVATSWHDVHIGSFATGGTGLIMMEASGVVPEGRISTACLGIWNEAQTERLKPIVDFAHSMGTKIGIQLAHAGRKASCLPPWSDHPMASKAEGGWDCVAPSAISFGGKYPVPKELTVAEIKTLVKSFADAAKRAVMAGFDLVEIHAAHGYLIHQFLSPISNKRHDEYGGSFENRIRFFIEITEAVRKAIPDAMPLFARISASDWLEDGWTIDESVELCKLLKSIGVDLIDVSSGGTSSGAPVPVGPGYQVPFAERIRRESNIFTCAVGLITEARQANEIVESGRADAVMMAREFLRNPRWPLQAAKELNAEVSWPNQL